MKLPALLLEAQNPQRDRLTAAAPDIVLALIYLFTWIAPHTFGENAVLNLIFVLIFEFVILHSASVVAAILMGRIDREGGGNGILIFTSLFYLLFGVGFSLVIDAWWPTWTIMLLTLNRLLTLRRPAALRGTGRIRLIIAWGMTFGGYFFLMFFVHLFPWPPLGVDAGVIDHLMAQGSGSFFEVPQIPLAFGFLYYLGVGLAEWNDLFSRVANRIAEMMEPMGASSNFLGGIFGFLFGASPPTRRKP